MIWILSLILIWSPSHIKFHHINPYPSTSTDTSSDTSTPLYSTLMKAVVNVKTEAIASRIDMKIMQDQRLKCNNITALDNTPPPIIILPPSPPIINQINILCYALLFPSILTFSPYSFTKLTLTV